MARHKASGPTDRELTILGILWNNGPSTVRQVNEVMNKHEKIGYTTTLKLMQIMVEKGLVKRDKSQVTHIYRPNVAQDSTQKQLVSNLMDKAFGGSARKLVMQALATKKVSPKELQKIEKLLNSIEGE